MKWIDDIISGLIARVGNNKIDDILSELNIHKFVVSPDSSLLQNNKAVYQRIGNFECIYIADDVLNKDFVIAHEIGHALLHTDEMELFYNPVFNKGKIEREADYFACKLLYSNLEIEDGIETKSQLATFLGVNEDVVDYIINKN